MDQRGDSRHLTVTIMAHGYGFMEKMTIDMDPEG